MATSDHVAPRTAPRLVTPLAPESTDPLYRQVHDSLMDMILSGDLSSGQAIPSSRVLAARLGISRNTAAQAVDLLIAEGVAQAHPRSGVYVADAVAPCDETVARAPSGTPVDWTRRLPRSRHPHRTSPLHPDWGRYRYPFIPGQTDAGLFPLTEWRRAQTLALRGDSLAVSLADTGDADDTMLITALRDRVLPARGIRADNDEILVTAGAQQALALIASLVVHGGTRAVIEDPGYVDAASILTDAGAELIPCPVDRDGIILPRTGRIDCVYVTPGHHHPTGATLSFARRMDLLRRASAERFLVIEDDYDTELRFRGRPTPCLKSLDRANRVIYVGSFSKTLAPGLRLGFVVGDAPLIAALRERRRLSVKSVSSALQRALAHYLAAGAHARTLVARRTAMRSKWETLVSVLDSELPWEIDPSAGGTSLWLELPEGTSARAVAARAARRGVLVDVGADFYLSPDGPDRALRIGLAAIPADDVAEGARRLARTVVDEIEHR